jgi:ATP-dependent DNA ligase
MPSTFEFCLPIGAASVPDRPDWLHEVKYDGYRVRLEREANRVRLITRGGLRLDRPLPVDRRRCSRGVIC